jgi:hypothetical protein
MTPTDHATDAMSCSDFIDRFSEYFDRVGDERFIEDAEAHLASCPSCRRYLEVIERGRELIRSLPSARVAGDFYPRLKHRLFHVDDRDSLSRGSAGSATTGVTILGMAVLLTLVAWAPLMRGDEQEVEKNPTLTTRPTNGALGLRPPPVSFSVNTGWSHAGRMPRDLWEAEHLLWEYSSLHDSYGQVGGLRRVGLD